MMTVTDKVECTTGTAEWERFISDVTSAKSRLGQQQHLNNCKEPVLDFYQDIKYLIPNAVYMQCKRLLDTVLVVAAAPALVLIALITALLIKMEDGGAIFFVQPRIGFRGRIFRIFKFRTMRTDTSAQLEFTERNDTRITRIGRVLRRHRIDELPQVINILRGEMSWIGPRPESLPLSRWYQSMIPFYAYRHIVKPGISGLAQVQQGWAAQLEDVEKKLGYDLYYIKNFSPWLDAFVLSRTFQVIATGFGAR